MTAVEGPLKSSELSLDRYIFARRKRGEVKFDTLGRAEYQYAERDERGNRLCQGRLCVSGARIQRKNAVKVCHHENCQENNKNSPLLLCLKCDELQHLGSASTHARFDISGNGGLNRSPSSHSLGSESDAEDEVDGENIKPDKKTRGYSSGKRMFKLTTAAKKKNTRSNVSGEPGKEFLTLYFHHDKSEDYDVEMVKAVKGKSLKDVLELLFAARKISFETHSVFLDASHTPLPLAFDTFPLGGNILHVKANADVKVDKRVINIVRNIEDKDAAKTPSEELVRNSSFMRTGSISTVKSVKPDEKEKDQSADKIIVQQLKSSQRGKKNITSFLGDDPSSGLYPSASSPSLTVGLHSSHSNASSLHRPKSTNRLTGLFNQPRQSREGSLKGVDGIKDVLDRYEIYGLDDTSIDYVCGPDDDDMKLEDSWTEVVSKENTETMSKKQKDLQEAIWELLTTEITYIKKLKVLKKLFILCLRNLQSEGFLQDIEMERLFSNIEKIYEVNLSFWLDCLRQTVIKSRKTGDSLDPTDMAEGFPMFESRFEPYITYCMEEAKCLKYLKEKLQEDENFKTYILWCEEHRMCTDRLKLNDLLVKPMQRVTKYPLLLKAINKKTQDDEMKTQVMRMISKTQSFLSKVNGAMRIRHEEEKLKKISDRILVDSYCAVEPVNEEMERILTEFSSLDLMGPMPGGSQEEHRCILQEGSLRLVEKQGKMDVYVFLFTDVMIITKPKKGDKYRVLKPPLPVDKLVVRPSRDPGMFFLIYLNEYNTIVQGFALQGTVTDQQNWTDTIKKAQKLYAVAQLGRGSGKRFQARYNSDSSELASPSTALINKYPDDRRGSDPSIISLDSDSENGEPCRPHTLPRYKPETTLVHTSSTRSDGELVRQTQAWKKGMPKIPKRRTSLTKLKRSLNEEEQSLSTVTDSEEKKVTEQALRDEKFRQREVSRSSSAPTKQRPRLEVAVSRSSSEPQGPKRSVKRSSRELPVLTKRNSSEGSVTSSSLSLEDSAVESATGSFSSLQTSTEISSPSIKESVCSETFGEENALVGNELILESDTYHSELILTESLSQEQDGDAVALVVGSDEKDCADLGSSSPQQEFPDLVKKEAETDRTYEYSTSTIQESPETTERNSSPVEPLESSPKPQGSGKQTPHIRSPLLTQDTIRSAISPTVPTSDLQKRRSSLPKRSSPVTSRKQRPKSLVRNSPKSPKFDNCESPDISPVSPPSSQRSVEQLFAEQNSASALVNREVLSNDFKPPGKLSLKRSSEPLSNSSRLPVKPDQSHYSVGLSPDKLEPDNELISASDSSWNKYTEHENELENGPRSAPPTSKVPRKKSVSLMDLLSFGRELTSSREKNKDKENELKKEKDVSTDYVTTADSLRRSSSPEYDQVFDNNDEKQTQKHRFRLRRSKSRTELKDGIASGPNMDKRRASKLFLKESLLLESSSCDGIDSCDSGSYESIPDVQS